MITIEEVIALGWADDNDPERYYFIIEKPRRDDDGQIVTDWTAYKVMYVLYTPWHKKTDEHKGYFEGTEFRIKKWAVRPDDIVEDTARYIFKGNLDSISELEVLMKQVGI